MILRNLAQCVRFPETKMAPRIPHCIGRRTRFGSACATSALLVLAITVKAFQTDGMREFPNRREGTTIRQNAADDFKILAVHRGLATFTRNTQLLVHFFTPPTDNPKVPTINVEACELQDTHHYLMQAKPDPNWKSGQWLTFGPWPTSDVIDRVPVGTGNLGVLTTMLPENAGTPVYLPAEVATPGEHHATAAYTIFFVTGKDLQKLNISVTTQSGTKNTPSTPPQECDTRLNPNCTVYRAGSTQAIDIDFSRMNDGIYHIAFTGTIPRSSVVPSIAFSLYHHAEPHQ